MAEAMLSTLYRDSLQSLNDMTSEQETSIKQEYDEPQKDSTKRVKHGPTTVIQIGHEKRRKLSTSVTASHVVDGKCMTRYLFYNKGKGKSDRRTIIFFWHSVLH
jgi:hypothetical protein